MTAVLAILEEQGVALLLQLYHQPDEAVIPLEEILQPGDDFIIKEPFFKVATNGSYTLRVDHPGDMVRLLHGDDCIPVQWKTRSRAVFPKASTETRAQGH